ncbi:hypothetical protein CORC01_03091 [Colletotrichum orchidophilum]|uniref:Uncharacterized protein n=1 Tax=Colletotrichum orchidophilum TaxID=1209926 RepID=A0A1G4BJJ0_9PEZI|nr:uncharacterized protein CORC01_03091 [Colletotrichum orchidophilum]OHF01601.1 hypothetical protein CORC01_03091 [Colletotrichum orchidophilum]
MVISSLGFLPGLDDIEYHGIGTSSEINVVGIWRDGSKSPDGSSISLEPRKEAKDVLRYRSSYAATDEDGVLTAHRPKVELSKQEFRRSSAPSPESLVDMHENKDGSPNARDDDAGRATRSSSGTPATPEASSSGSLVSETTPQNAGPLESYLACPHSHERRALWLPPDDDDRERDADPSTCGSVVLGKGRVPGVYEQPKRNTSPFGTAQGTKDGKIGQPLTQYLSSIHPHEVLAYQMWELESKSTLQGSNRYSCLEMGMNRSRENVMPASNPSISLEAGHKADDVPPAPAVPSPAMSAVPAPQGPIEVGYERHGSDSAISDLDTAELYQLL